MDKVCHVRLSRELRKIAEQFQDMCINVGLNNFHIFGDEKHISIQVNDITGEKVIDVYASIEPPSPEFDRENEDKEEQNNGKF